MNAGTEPISHTPPYKRIDLGQRAVPIIAVNLLEETGAQALHTIQQREADRIWAITKQVAEGCNQPSAEPAP